jgi:hypothetical protein
MFAWTSKTNIHWIVPIIGIAIVRLILILKCYLFINGPEALELPQEPE